jgi:hypothetical protein
MDRKALSVSALEEGITNEELAFFHSLCTSEASLSLEIKRSGWQVQLSLTWGAAIKLRRSCPVIASTMSIARYHGYSSLVLQLPCCLQSDSVEHHRYRRYKALAN